MRLSGGPSLRGPAQHPAGFGCAQVLAGKAWARSPPVTLTKLLKSPSGMTLGSVLPGISKVRARLSREMRVMVGPWVP